MISQERRNYSNKIGSETEHLFVLACNSIGYTCEKTDKNTDIYEHIDFWIKKPDGTKTSVDVKGCNHPNVIWVEFKNVQGNDGWLYGKADYIAFDMPKVNGFVVVHRVGLLKECEKIVEKKFVSKSEATRKLYQRDGRKDVITRLELKDLENLSSYKIVKYSEKKESIMPI
jgi:hypothetical protein